MTDDIITENTTDQQREMAALLAFNSLAGMMQSITNKDKRFEMGVEIITLLGNIVFGDLEPKTGECDDKFLDAYEKYGK